MDQLILDEAIELVDRTLNPADAAIVLGNATWHPGVIASSPSRLVERYGRPTFLVGWDEAGELGRGSGRSIPGFDLHGALHKVGTASREVRGHTMAAGFTIRRDRSTTSALRSSPCPRASHPRGPGASQRVDLECRSPR